MVVIPMLPSLLFSLSPTTTSHKQGVYHAWGFPGSSVGKESPEMQETPGQFLGWDVPLEKGYVIHSSILGFPGDSDGKEFTCNAGDLGSSLSGKISWRRGYATHSDILAWRIPLNRGA